jgi:hypothetical protein
MVFGNSFAPYVENRDHDFKQVPDPAERRGNLPWRFFNRCAAMSQMHSAATCELDWQLE